MMRHVGPGDEAAWQFVMKPIRVRPCSSAGDVLAMQGRLSGMLGVRFFVAHAVLPVAGPECLI
jgi:hypothetical protein